MMKKVVEYEPSHGQSTDLPTLVTVICHLMTLYAMRPCEHIAANIDRHLFALLTAPAAEALGSWRGTFEKLQIQWRTIARRHALLQSQKVQEEATQSVTH